LFVAIRPGIVFIAASAILLSNIAVADERQAPVTKSDPDRTTQNRSEPLPLPRDPDIAVREEFEAARAQNTVGSWELFVARHGGHPLAVQAKQELEKLQKKPSR
jgi:hypothetical protein